MSANVLHVLCPTCGVTRAFSCFMHLDFKAAFSYNPIFTVAFGPIFVFLFLEDLVNIVIHFFKKKIIHQSSNRYIFQNLLRHHLEKHVLQRLQVFRFE